MASTSAAELDPHGVGEPTAAAKERKRFVPLENNPEVMNQLIYQLGVSNAVAFHDVYSIDDPELLAFVPRPAHALMLIFPTSDTYEKFRVEEDSKRDEYKGSGPDEPVIWYKQTIGNACGLIALLHGVSNGKVRDLIEPGSKLSQLLTDAIPLKPNERADLLYESQALESAHAAAASVGDSEAPEADLKVDLHFVCFVKSEDNHLWELDGRRTGPLDRGTIGQKDDVLSQSALDLGVRSFLKREAEAGGGDLRFSLIALGPSFD
ncbi:peptidase C12, ubiquitin carboxyl-terminal hydrolase 1 [Eremomyces bilateralis CBS 781.70]|uniref:Ubiquitin carboxyl-terminal hydrolase n=1 Tax=Eremomyces bilateralis CBS 781.70 TaxID=1392243 RepID=A0A6G1G7S6_9PEZI|nr:peptidase C12, ubiquitin carboxyl-terminal hydrolase 1 [Eremomyces bilateralis CBS 781.70]KAF1814127.1 peptidase C12, ubiquitin carboxyl-terminal hydrolase 1 [Eremomyces bilateralis CBS 781.70]